MYLAIFIFYMVFIFGPAMCWMVADYRRGGK